MVAHVDNASILHQKFIFFRTANVPKFKSQQRKGVHNCRNWHLTGDVCAGRSHKGWSLSCALAEARFLDRILVLPDVLCCHPNHCGGTEWCASALKFFSLAGPHVALEHQLEAVHLNPTLLGCNATTSHMASELSHARVVQYRQVCTQYYYLRCEGSRQATGDVSLVRTNDTWQPWGVPASISKAGHAISAAIKLAALESNADAWCVHVRRGDKLNMRYWPCTSEDTSSFSIEQTLLHSMRVRPGSVLYVATNERDPHHFSPLNRSFHVYKLNDFASLVPAAAGPEAAAIIDYDVCNLQAPQVVETFSNLTELDHTIRQSQAIHTQHVGDLYLTTDPKPGCSANRARSLRCETRYPCMTQGHWSYSDTNSSVTGSTTRSAS